MWSHIFRHDHQTPQSGFFIQTLSSYGRGLNRPKWFSFLNTFLYLSYGSLKRCWDQILLPITLISYQFHICFILQANILYALHILSFLFLSCRQGHFTTTSFYLIINIWPCSFNAYSTKLINLISSLFTQIWT